MKTSAITWKAFQLLVDQNNHKKVKKKSTIYPIALKNRKVKAKINDTDQINHRLSIGTHNHKQYYFSYYIS